MNLADAGQRQRMILEVMPRERPQKDVIHQVRAAHDAKLFRLQERVLTVSASNVEFVELVLNLNNFQLNKSN